MVRGVQGEIEVAVVDVKLPTRIQTLRHQGGVTHNINVNSVNNLINCSSTCCISSNTVGSCGEVVQLDV